MSDQNNQNNDNQNGGYSILGTLESFFAPFNPILSQPQGPRVSYGFGPGNIQMPQQQNYGDVKVLPSPTGIVVSPTGKAPQIPMPQIPTLNLKVDPFGKVVDSRQYGVPAGQKNYNVDYKLGYGIASPFVPPQIIPDDKLPKSGIAMPMGMPITPPLSIGIPQMRVPQVQVYSPIYGPQNLSFGMGIPRINLNPDIVRVTVSNGLMIEVIEGKKDDIVARLKGRYPDIAERLGYKEPSVEIAPENILDDIRKPGVSFRKDGEDIIAEIASFRPATTPGITPPTRIASASTDNPQKRFRSANIVLITNQPIDGTSNVAGAFVVFKKAHPGDGTYVPSPFCKPDLSSTVVNETQLWEAAKKSVERASNGYIKIGNYPMERATPFDYELVKGVYNRTYCIYIDGVNVSEFDNKVREARSATSSNPLEYDQIAMISFNRIANATELGSGFGFGFGFGMGYNLSNAIRVQDNLSRQNLILTIPLNRESMSQLKKIVVGYDSKPQTGIISTIRVREPKSVKTSGSISLMM